MTINNEETARELPVIKNWNSESLRERQQEEDRLGQFGLGFVRAGIEIKKRNKETDGATRLGTPEEQAQPNIEVTENEHNILVRINYV